MQQELAELAPEKVGPEKFSCAAGRSAALCTLNRIQGHQSPRVLHAARETRTGSLRRNPGITCEQLRTKKRGSPTGVEP
jgi:hypothetical protein